MCCFVCYVCEKRVVDNGSVKANSSFLPGLSRYAFTPSRGECGFIDRQLGRGIVA